MPQLKLYLWVWAAAILVAPIFYIIEAKIGEAPHNIALVIAIGISLMTGVVCTFIVASNKNQK